MPSAVQPDACYHCDGLERGTKVQKQALGGESPTARLGMHASLQPRKSKQVIASVGCTVKDNTWCNFAPDCSVLSRP